MIIPVGIRDRAMFAVLAYSGCRVGELVKLRVCAEILIVRTSLTLVVHV